jgi:hypothetical protein
MMCQAWLVTDWMLFLIQVGGCGLPTPGGWTTKILIGDVFRQTMTVHRSLFRASR